MPFRPDRLLAAAALLALATAAAAGPGPAAGLEEIVVTARLRPGEALREVPASVAVLDEAAVQALALQHFEELGAAVPNLGFSGEGARARYFQVRGSGELEQYEGAPNPSVGFVIDDVDFSGIGGIATTFDTARVEVLRGPQATRYGANALAGMIYLSSVAPTAEPDARVETLAGSDGARGIGAAGGGPVPGTAEALAWRLALQQFRGDGFRRNAYLGRDDSARRDELTGRGRLRWHPAPGWQVDATALYVDIDDGYDDWSIDNGFTTQSDQPGRDAQRSRAGSLRVAGDLGTAASLVSITATADSDIRFGFDADWGNPALWAPDVYAYTQLTDRERDTLSQELRLLSGPDGRLFGRVDWLLGAYGQRLEEDNLVTDHGLLDLDDAACPAPPDPGAAFCAPLATDRSVASRYRATSLALFGEVSLPLGSATRLALGLRGERREARYQDQLDDRAAAVTASNQFAPTDRLWGGELTLTRELGPLATVYGRVARGYKAGGFNPGLARSDFSQPGLQVSREQIEFGPEALWNYEIGTHLGDADLWLDASLFWQQRERMQVRVPIQLSAGDPNTFIFLTDNAQAARALGAEAQLSWRLGASLTLRAGLGLLDTELQRFATRPEFEGREFPHAPPLSWSAGLLWRDGAGWFASLDASGRGRYVFDYDSSTGGDRKAPAAELFNLRAGRRWGHWEAVFWVRNLFDETWVTRGYYFGNEPPDFPARRYLRLGDPRQLGVGLAWRL
ncbi:putative TonB-dependent receptor BfrD [Gammaproteobacteria bacterium]|nr:TonB-dependent receptor [Gammaproteobacteria bacterium]CAG0938035.1 putative TonB-dependent receptor BfrD [Gammaproteobacteria bacterium]